MHFFMQAIKSEYQQRKEALQKRIEARKQAAEQQRSNQEVSTPDDAAVSKAVGDFHKTKVHSRTVHWSFRASVLQRSHRNAVALCG